MHLSTRVNRDQGTRDHLARFTSRAQKVKIEMARRQIAEKSSLKRVLARAKTLAEQVRETAERVHQEAQEARRLTDVARQQAERGRELSKAGREEARAEIDSIMWSVDTAGNGKRRASGGDKT